MVKIVIGGSYGSEGKGAFVHHLAKTEDFDVVVRTGGPQAGHSMIYEDKVYKMRQIPCAWDKENILLVIPVGGLVNPQVLRNEIEMLKSLGINLKGRLLIDENATVVDPSCSETEENANMAKKIGSTQEGTGAAVAGRAMRTAKLVKDLDDDVIADYTTDTVSILNEYAITCNVLIETAQGWGLSVFSSGFYPFCTSREISASATLAECALPPNIPVETTLMFRTLPIRVGGNSGPMRHETSFKELGLPEERTTVTNRVRRIGYWDEELAKTAILVNNPDSLAISFMDYLFPEDEGIMDYDKLSNMCKEWIGSTSVRMGIPIKWICTGFEKVVEVTCE